MKNIASLFVLLICTFLLSCNDDDSSPAQNTPQEIAEGDWHLVQVSGSIAGVNHIFEPGTIAWTFNDDGTVSVENTNTNEFAEDFLETGTYPYSYTANNQMPICEVVLVAGGINFGCQEINGDDLTLTQAVEDGYILKFTR